MDTRNLSHSAFLAPEQWEAAPKHTSPHSRDPQPFWGEDGFTFDDVLDSVNPLHHIPVAATEYQKASNDTASEGAKFVGGVVFGLLTGGAVGVAAALVNAAIRHDTGKDLPQHALALLEGGSPGESAEVPVAEEGIANNGRVSAASPLFTADPKSVQSGDSPALGAQIDSVHPDERLTAVNHYFREERPPNAVELRQRAETASLPAMKEKLSQAYREQPVSDAGEGEFWWDEWT